MQSQPRNGAKIDRIYVHTNEGPETENGAASLVAYLQRIDGGYHVVVDDHNTIRAANDNAVLWSEGGDNMHALAVCIIGSASQTPAQWKDAYSAAATERAAQVVAAWCRQYDIPAVHVRPGAPGQAPTDRGIAEHADDHAPSSQGHTDPGAGFDIAAFVARVEEIIDPYGAWVARVSATPLKFGDSGHDVGTLQDLLAGHSPVGTDTGKRGHYDVDTAAVVGRFKKAHGLENTDGRHFGRDAAEVITAR